MFSIPIDYDDRQKRLISMPLKPFEDYQKSGLPFGKSVVLNKRLWGGIAQATRPFRSGPLPARQRAELVRSGNITPSVNLTKDFSHASGVELTTAPARLGPCFCPVGTLGTSAGAGPGNAP